MTRWNSIPLTAFADVVGSGAVTPGAMVVERQWPRSKSCSVLIGLPYYEMTVVTLNLMEYRRKCQNGPWIPDVYETVLWGLCQTCLIFYYRDFFFLRENLRDFFFCYEKV